jgi:hypothetical protein
MQDALDKTGVFCLSESPKDPDLWRRCASDGAGVCFELESDYVTEPDFGPFKVTYSDRPKPLWDRFARADKRRKLVDAHLLQKSTFWKRQAEWRCIRKWEPQHTPTANRYYPIAPSRPHDCHIWLETERRRAAASHRMDPDGWLAADRGLETSATRRWASQNPRLYEAGAESYPERLTGFAE